MPNVWDCILKNSDYFPSGQPDRVSLEECSGLNPLATPVLNWTQLPNRLYTYSHKHASEKLVLAGCPDVSLKRGQHQRFFNLSPSINQHFSADKRAISQVPLLIPSCRSGLSKVVDLNHTECIEVLHVRASTKGDWWGWQASTITAIGWKRYCSRCQREELRKLHMPLLCWFIEAVAVSHGCILEKWNCQVWRVARWVSIPHSGSTQSVFSDSQLFYLKWNYLLWKINQNDVYTVKIL